MDSLADKYKQRNKISMELTNAAFEWKDSKDIPFIFNTANYFSFGYSRDELPKDYYETPEAMYRRQIQQFENHYPLIEDNYVPYLMPWYGTGVTASAFGIGVNFLPKMDPTTEVPDFPDPDDIDKMTLPDFEKAGVMPKVIEAIKYFMANSDLPVCFTDNHGPLTLAVQVIGYDKLFYWMYDYPKKIHALMDLLSTTVIEWVMYQKQLIGQPKNHCFGNQGVYVPPGVGVWFSDDDAVILPAHLYKEFVVPYNEKILKYFDGGIIHFCGNGNQHIENFKSMEYLRGINNFALGEWQALLELKAGLEGKAVVVACDFTHRDYRGYYGKLFDEYNMSKKGLVVQSLFAPTTAVEDGKYILVERDEETVAEDMQSVMETYFRG
jgi:uroporphyrinogen-III decarboxylase